MQQIKISIYLPRNKNEIKLYFICIIKMLDNNLLLIVYIYHVE